MICERLCHSDNTHCPACTSNKLVSLAEHREAIITIATNHKLIQKSVAVASAVDQGQETNNNNSLSKED